MQLSNVRQIVAEEYSPEDRETISRLGGVLNFFMRQVVELSNNNVDFDNLTWDLIQLDVTVDANGSPVPRARFSSSVAKPTGLLVINAQNITNSLTYPTGAPFINFTPQGSGIAEINNISGLQAENKYRLTVVVF
jgi:hypothetical protein